MQEHELKTWPKHFQAVYSGLKSFEFRYNDRNFHLGDTLILREWIPRNDYRTSFRGWYTGRAVRAVVTYVLREYEELPEFVADNFVVMSIRLISRRSIADNSEQLPDETSGEWVMYGYPLGAPYGDIDLPSDVAANARADT